jgi:hypothetical protein
VQGFTLTYSGEELRQDDQDVFLQLVHMMRAVPIGHMIEATGYGILSALGWGSGGKDYSRLRTSIERLARTNIEIKGEDLLFIGRLLPSMTRVGSTASSRFSLWLDPNVIKLFGKDMYSMVDWEDRLSLSVLAKWLHSFYFTHREPKAYRVDTLHQLCGSKQKELRVFKQKLRLALEELVVIKFLVSFEIMGNLVAVQRQHQLRQLNS